MYGIYKNGSVIAQFAAPMSVTSNVPVFIGDAQSLKRTVVRRPAQRWEISTNLSPLSYGAEELFTLMVTHGHFSPIEVIMPQNYGTLASRSFKLSPSNYTVTGLKDQETVVIVNQNSYYIPSGTFIKFSSHDKIYVTTNSLQAGAQGLSIFPKLRQTISGDTFTAGDDVIGKFFFDTDTIIGMSYTDGILMDNGTIKLIEAL